MTSPNTKRQIDRAQRRRSRQDPPRRGTVQGVLPGHDFLSWVTDEDHDLPLIVFNNGDAGGQKRGAHVYVGRERDDKRFQILRRRIHQDKPYGGSNPNVGLHAPEHFWSGRDPVWLHTCQLTPLLVYPAGGLIVRVNGGNIQTTNGFAYVPLRAFDLTAHVPVSGARYVLVQISQAAEVTVKAGSVATYLADLTFSDIPACDIGCMPLGAVRLVAGMTEISRNYEAQDIIDLRFAPLHTSLTGGSVSLYSVVVYDPATQSVEFYQGSVAGLTSALAAAPTGGIILVPAGTFASNFTQPTQTTVVGAGPQATIITGTWTASASTDLADLQIELTANTAGDLVGVEGPASDGMTITNCNIKVNNTGTGNAYCLRLNGGWIGARNAYLRAIAADAGAVACILKSGAAIDDVVFEECIFANGTDLNTAPAANWSLADGPTTPALYGCIWPTLWTPTGISYLLGDRAAWNHTHASSNLTVKEADDAPSVSGVNTIKFPNGSLTDDGSGVVTITFPAPISDHGALTGLSDDDHTQYALLTPGSSVRNVIQPGGNFIGLVLKNNAGQVLNIFEHHSSAGSPLAWLTPAGVFATTQVIATDANGLKLYEDGGKGIFVKDGGFVGVNNTSPLVQFHVIGGEMRISQSTNSDTVFSIRNSVYGFDFLVHGTATGTGATLSLGSGGAFKIKNSSNQTVFDISNTSIGGLGLYVFGGATNTLATLLTLSHRTTGTPAAGFGGEQLLKLESSTTDDRDAARIAWRWTTATDASRTAELALATVDSAGALTDRLIVDGSKIRATGHIQADGDFYLGDTATDGSWRLAKSGNDLVIQRRESGSWVTKHTVAA